MEPYDELDLATQKEQYERQALVTELGGCIKKWGLNYTRLIRAMVDTFGEEEVLDIVEQVWWNQSYEAAKLLREEFDKDPRAAMAAKASSWHDNPVWTRGCTCAVPILEDDRWDLVAVKCLHEFFREIDERKIGISWCLADMAAVRGWSPKIVMEFPRMMLRGDDYCYQIRKIVDKADPALDRWSKEISEKNGWRSIKKLEDL